MPISELLLLEFDEEMKKTRTTLERIPADKPDFAPHPKSMVLGKLAPHVAQLAGFGFSILTTPELDFSKGSYKPVPLESAEQLVRVFDEGVAKVRGALLSAPDEGVEGKLETQLSGQGPFQRIALFGVPSDVPESSGASSRPAWRLFAAEWQARSFHLRAVRG